MSGPTEPQAPEQGGPEPEVSIVLPAHNELSLLGSTVTNLLSGLDARALRYELIVVENGSSDGTLQLARVLAAQIPVLRVVSLPRGDYGAALAAGFAKARGRFVVNFDVDYYDLAFLDGAIGLLRGGAYAVVLASKRAPGAADRRPLVRRLLTAGFATLLRWAVRLEVSDAHGMKAMARTELLPIVARCSLRGSLFDVELVARAVRQGLAVHEVPAVVAERRPPRSSVLARSVESALGVLRLRRVLRLEAPARRSTGTAGPARRLRLRPGGWLRAAAARAAARVRSAAQLSAPGAPPGGAPRRRSGRRERRGPPGST